MNVTERLLAEYRDLPGLRLTTRQAARLCGLEPVHCECLLNRLVTDGHLLIDAKGQFAAAGPRGHLCSICAPEPTVE